MTPDEYLECNRLLTLSQKTVEGLVKAHAERPEINAAVEKLHQIHTALQKLLAEATSAEREATSIAAAKMLDSRTFPKTA